ncbi:unnamed protein product [Arctia plantaginis]|uniref:Uncharacterized protein n=1 Tax=Arctia plantaginis TaxID=874455 RepID=A0A8S0ZQL2_ARCPL|nr:unnamed protein product [Arctia plantaginis]
MGKKFRCGCSGQSKDQKLRIRDTDCKDVATIIEALTAEEILKRLTKKPVSKAPMFKMKPFKPPHFKDTCVPMVPSMHTRLRYIGHCPVEPPISERRLLKGVQFQSSSEDEDENIMKKDNRPLYKKKVRYVDLMPGDILMPAPVPIVKHKSSDTSILNVPSPKTSGEIIRAERAIAKPGEIRPPLPPKAGHELFKPHSGLIVNRDKSFVPDIHVVPAADGATSKRKRKVCDRKKCRKYRAMLRRKGFKTQKRGRTSYTNRGVTDGKPRARGAKKLHNDDSACGLDEIPRPQHVEIPMNLKKGMLQTHSLTVLPCTKDRRPDIHYGILTGSFNMYDSKFPGRSRGRQALTMSVMAYCLAFHYHPKQWTMKLVDNLVDAGDVWYIQCLEKVHDHSAVQGICEVLPFGKKQILVLNGKRMQVLLGEPDIVGYTMSLDPMVYNLCRGLKAFFKENRAGVMMSRIMKVVIWKDRVCYYIFDPAGRDSRAYSNFASGQAAIMNVKDLNSVADILLARSILGDQKFVLAPVKVLKMIDEKADEDLESDKELTAAEKAMMGYRILTENCAIVNANMHLGDRCFEDAKYRQAIPIAVVAMTYAKISPPNTWFSKTLDKVLRLGNKLYVDCAHPKVVIDITIDNIPNEIFIGPYACEIIIYRERVKGQLFATKECFLNIKTGLQELFKSGYNSGILEFNNYAMAVWRQKDMYYLFDPYPRTNDGLRALKTGKACCFMVLNPEALADVITKNFDYLPATTQFNIHAFKVLKLKKKQPKTQIVCTLSDENLPGKAKRKILEMAGERGDGTEAFHNVVPADSKLFEPTPKPGAPQVDEEQMGDIISLVDSIQEDYLPPIPLKYRVPDTSVEPKVVNLDSPTVSVTQVVPPWPKPRDKTNEPPEPDPDPEPTPPPTPPPVLPPEGGIEEEEEVEEEEDEETIAAKKAEAERKKAEEEEARRKAEELPPPLPPPPPSPQPEAEVPLAPPTSDVMDELEAEGEVEALEPINVERRILLTEDARRRYKLRQIRKKMTPPLSEPVDTTAPIDKELAKPSNFKDLPDRSQIVRGSSALAAPGAVDSLDVLPFGAIMAIVTSFKYTINTWNSNIVNFVVDTAKKLYDNKEQKFQLAPVHIIPKIAIGHQAYHATIDVIGEGPSWQLEEYMSRKFFDNYDRGMVTTATYSCAFFKRANLYYLFDGSACNAMGLRTEKKGAKGSACFLRFRSLHELVSRMLYNKDGKTEDQQFVISRILVRRLLQEPREALPEDYDYEARKPKSSKSKSTIVPADKRKSSVAFIKIPPVVGYQRVDGVYRIEGTTALTERKPSTDIKSCHFVSLIAMLMAAMHPIRTWDQFMIDTCIEKGLEIKEKATNFAVCEKRVIKNVILDGKFLNVNIKKILVVNENPEKTLEQYLKAVMRRLRYVIIRYPHCSMVICHTDGFFHLFDPYPPPAEEPAKDDVNKPSKKGNAVATWTLYRSLDFLIKRIRKMLPLSTSDSPEFYTFELTSVKTAPRHSALNYRLSPLFKPDVNPNEPYLKRRRAKPAVNEKMYWLNIELIPWSRMSPTNGLGLPRNIPKTLWKDWDIEFPGDLFSLWGSIHSTDKRFDKENRGQQYLATTVLAVGLTETCELSAWTGGFLDGLVINGDKYHQNYLKKVGSERNQEILLEKLDSKFDEIIMPAGSEGHSRKMLMGL